MKEKEMYNILQNEQSEFKKVEIKTFEDSEIESENTNINQIKNKFFKKLINFKNSFLKFSPYFLGILAVILYLFTLKGCQGTQFECLQIITNDVIKKMLIILLIAALLYKIQIILVIKNNDHLKPFILITIFFAFICFVYDTGADFDSHGAYNRLIFFFFVLIWGLIYLFWRLILNLFKRYPIITFISLLIFLLGLNSLRLSIVEHSCSGWENGLKGVPIDNSGESTCKIRPPQVCYFKILDGWMDFTKLFGESCNTMNTNKLSNNIDHMKDKTAKVIGYPRTEKYKYFPDSQENVFQKNVIRNIVNMEDPLLDQKLKENIEVITDYNQNPPKVTLDLKRNEKLVKSRLIKYEKFKENILSKNVMHIFIDSVSRPNFKRKLPQLHKWLEDKYSLPNESYHNKKIESFQFLKFHGLGTFTGINMVPAVFGVYNIYYNGKHYIKDYKQKGFITAQATGYCGREIFGMDPGAIVHLGWDHFDHELASFFCDGNYTPYNDMYAILVGINSPRIRCLYNKSIASYNLEYATQFFDKYKKEAKFMRMMFYEGHEGTQEVIKYTDTEITQFLKKFEKQGYLDDTIIIIQTDHGLGMAGVYSGLDLEDYHKETVLPSLFLVLPTNLKNYSIIRENLKYNEQSMATHFTVFNTLHAIVGGKEFYSYNEDLDLFNDKIPRTRNCNELKSHMYWNSYTLHCRCEEN